ncbi:MAG: hypothetical protein MRERC_1c084 [Mycoplasmataceae bacterium RC_NB112A]|nr:MAG: hypothetical protein MRERC_1c084 [Mycoplasmataceae bacterium RC_NB112A]
MIKQMSSVKIEASICQQLRNDIRKGNVSRFVERAVAKELGNYENKLEREQKEFLKKLIADYKQTGSSKNIQKEEDLWEEEVGEWLDE